MKDKNEFLKKYHISQSSFENTELVWENLKEIYNDYKKKQDNLKPTANYIAECLRSISSVHSLKIRLKDPEHLIEKIIRKKIDNKQIDLNIDNYSNEITDLIGIRALHLFKEDWLSINKYIKNQWQLHEKPTANIRKGDPSEYIKTFKDKGCEIKEHPFGYRSVHYLVKSSLAKEMHIVEIQVRTIFEEAWSEIDHHIRYPHDKDNPVLGQFLVIFNRLAGSADEMGSFVKLLKKELDQNTLEYQAVLKEKNSISTEFKKKIKELKITKEEKEELEQKINKLTETTIPSIGTKAWKIGDSMAKTIQFDGKEFIIGHDPKDNFPGNLSPVSDPDLSAYVNNKIEKDEKD